MYHPTESSHELLPGERGKTWTVKKSFTVKSRAGKKLTIRTPYQHDRYTFAPDCPDNVPAISHDFAYDPRQEGSGRRWDDGTVITRTEADDLLLFLMETSKDELTRNCAPVYYTRVRRWAWFAWHWATIKETYRRIRACLDVA